MTVIFLTSPESQRNSRLVNLQKAITMSGDIAVLEMRSVTFRDEVKRDPAAHFDDSAKIEKGVFKYDSNLKFPGVS